MTTLKFYASPNKIVGTSPWPILLSFSLFACVMAFIDAVCLHNPVNIFTLTVTYLYPVYIALLWFKDVSRERMVGYHTHKLEMRLRTGFLLFILREVFLFFSFFWSFFDSAMAPSVEYGLVWPPKGMEGIDPLDIPLLNTIILLSSGATITMGHASLMKGEFNNTVHGLWMTIGLGIYFLALQVHEYSEAPFSMADGQYGRIFFLLTGFHGGHVFVGTCMLRYALYNVWMCKVTAKHHFSFEAAAWYWHFVDVVWLFLYVGVYLLFS